MSTGMPEGKWNLVGDIGGTHTRFAMTRRDCALEQIKVVPTAGFPSLELAIRHYLQACGQPAIEHAIIGMANPVTGDRVRMTNSPWNFSIEETRGALGWESLRIINDFAALALSLPLLPQSELIQVGPGAAAPRKPLGLVGPGTGLGTAGLVPDRADGWLVLPGEGGHASFAPGNEDEVYLWREAGKQFGHISVERLISGSGLQFIYQAFSRLNGKTAPRLSPAEISKQALDNTCALSRQALDTFCAMLGAAAGDIALTLGARGGMYIGGGIVPKLGAYFATSPFRQRFESKGRFAQYLAAIPTFVIDSPYAALLGAASQVNACRAR